MTDKFKLFFKYDTIMLDGAQLAAIVGVMYSLFDVKVNPQAAAVVSKFYEKVKSGGKKKPATVVLMAAVGIVGFLYDMGWVSGKDLKNFPGRVLKAVKDGGSWVRSIYSKKSSGGGGDPDEDGVPKKDE